MENELSRIVDALPGLVWTASLDGSLDFANRRWCEYTGMGLEQARGPGWQGAIHPQDLPGLLERWRVILAHGQPREAEARMRRLDGEYRWFIFRVRPLSDASGQVVKWCGLNTDIEDRRRAEQELRVSEQHFRSIADSIPALIALMSPSGGIESVNRHVTDYFGLTLEELRIWKTTDLVHPDDRSAVIAAWTRAVDTVEPYDIEHRLRGADGVYRWFQVRALPLKDEQGRVARWYCLQTDIDDRKRAEAERRISEATLGNVRSELAHVARVTSLGVLTASIAHEVSQPLSGILTNAGTCLRMLAAEPPNVDGARETARRTIRDAHRASDVVTRLRALFSKTAAKTDSLDLNEATREVIALSSIELERGRVILRMDLAENLPHVTGDRVQLQQVILNLLLNASAAMSNIDDRPRSLLIGTELDEGDHVRLTVQDAGVGFDLQNAARLFEAFYTTKSGGMGIGLSVSQSIIESHRGRLWAAANAGPGATFAFSIPSRPSA